MHRHLVISVLAVALAGAAPGVAFAPGALSVEAQAIWDGFWGRVAVGDLDGARTIRAHHKTGLPVDGGGRQLQEMARQMQYCRTPSGSIADQRRGRPLRGAL